MYKIIKYKTIYLLFASESIAADDFPHFFSLFKLRVTLHHVIQRWKVKLQLLC